VAIFKDVNMKTRFLLAAAVAMGLSLPVLAQTDSDVRPVNDDAHVPVYRVSVTERTAKAIDYRHKGDTTKLDFVGTSLMPKADGHAEVKSHTGRLQIKAKFDHLDRPEKFGPQYLTYVLWAITPEGRPQNLGEVVLKDKDDHDADLEVSSNLQSFAMIVTAEPYYSVTRPSDVVVLENQVGPDIKADVQPITARYEALARNEYVVDLNPADLPAASEDDKTPLDLLEARNALAIAKATGASQYAEATFQQAQDQLTQAENAYRKHKNSTEIGTPARSAAQMAEDARVITIRKKQEEKVAEERRETERRMADARARADAEAQRAEQARLDAEKQQQERLRAEADRQAAEQARQQAELARQQALQEQQQAEQARQQAVAQQQQLAQQAQQAQSQAQQAQSQAQQAERARLQAEQQAQQTRERLSQQLNQVLQTRQTARGLIVNMNDVLFDTGKATLKPGARVRLAKVAGIIMAYPDLKLEIDGYTDSTGTPEFNRDLSQRRADTVRSFLASQGVGDGNIITHGYGEEEPIASNNTAEGRQLNRRVELVVSGNAIGMNGQSGQIGTTGSATAGTSGAVTTTGTTSVQTTTDQPAAVGGNANPR
jgi:outer membrane protein OmpA-like peptidoglycan-associated protein